MSMAPGINESSQRGGPFLVTVVAQAYPVRGIVVDTYDQAVQELRDWCAASKDMIWVSERFTPYDIDFATANFNELDDWFTQDGDSAYYLAITPLSPE